MKTLQYLLIGLIIISIFAIAGCSILKHKNVANVSAPSLPANNSSGASAPNNTGGTIAPNQTNITQPPSAEQTSPEINGSSIQNETAPPPANGTSPPQINETVPPDASNSSITNETFAGENGTPVEQPAPVVISHVDGPRAPLAPASCRNGIQDPDETDVDCGGSCPTKCGDGRSCVNDSDCAASNCTSGVCEKIPGGPGAYSDYEFRGIDNADELEIYLTWLDRPSENVGIYAAFTFGFEAGQGGYMGLQRDGSLPKDRAIFSIWSINDQSQTSSCVSTDFNATDLINCGNRTNSQSGEGNFGQALGMYAWKTGTEYRLRVESVGTDSSGELWRGSVTDMSTNVATEIGTIHLDDVKGFKGYGKLNPKAAVFLEYYYGHSGYCDDKNVFSRVMWRGPYINGKLADRGYTWYPIKCMYTRQYSPEKGVIVHEAGGTTAWENNERDFWN
jgi:hypothetical protein